MKTSEKITTYMLSKIKELPYKFTSYFRNPDWRSSLFYFLLWLSGIFLASLIVPDHKASLPKSPFEWVLFFILLAAISIFMPFYIDLIEEDK